MPRSPATAGASRYAPQDAPQAAAKGRSSPTQSARQQVSVAPQGSAPTSTVHVDVDRSGDGGGGAADEPGAVLTDEVPGVLTTATVLRAVKMWRPSARKVAEDLHRQELEEAIGARPDKAAQARRQVREMMLYAIFVVLFTAQTLFNRNNSDLFFFTNALDKQLVHNNFGTSAQEFEDVTTVGEAYAWLRGPLVQALYTASTFDGDDSYQAMNSGSSDDHSPNFPGLLVGRGIVIGGIRVGQVRSNAEVCSVPPSFGDKDLLHDSAWGCLTAQDDFGPTPGPSASVGWPNSIGNLTIRDPDTEDYGPEFTSPISGKAYSPPNVYAVLPNPRLGKTARDQAAAILKDMQDNSFVDLRTRALVVDINVYNPNLDYSCLVRMVFELPDGGGLLPWARMLTVRLYRDYRAEDHLRFVIEVLVMLMVVYYSFREMQRFWKGGIMGYWQSISITHNANLVLFYVSAIFRIWAFVELPATLSVAGNGFLAIMQSASLLAVTEDINAFNALLTWLKLFRYLNFVPRFQILLGTLSRAAGQVGGFSIICAVVLFGSSQAFTLLFGTTLSGYRNLTQSFFSLSSLLLGDFEFEELRYQQPILGPIIFGVFIMLAVFVLLNMFIAIISDAFSDEKDRLALMEDFGVETLGKHVAEALLEALESVPLIGNLVRSAEQRVAFYRFRVLHNHHMKQLALLADANQDNNVSPEEIAQSLDKDANGEVTREEVHDALIASGASDEAAHDIINKIPFSRQGVVSTTILAEMFRAATHTDSETDSEEGSARLDEDAVPPDSNLAGETVHSSEGAGHGVTQGGEQPSPESKEVPAPLRGVASAHSQESGWAYAETPLRTGHTTGVVSAFPFDSNDVATLDGQGPSRRSTADSSVWGSNGAGSGGGGGHGTEGGHRQRSSPGKRTRRSELETGHADTAMRALNKLRIGFANKKLEAHDSVAAGLMHTPKLKPHARRAPPSRPPKPRPPPRRGAAYRRRHRRDRRLSPTSMSVEYEQQQQHDLHAVKKMTHGLNSRIAAMEKLLYTNIRQHGFLLEELQKRNQLAESGLQRRGLHASGLAPSSTLPGMSGAPRDVPRRQSNTSAGAAGEKATRRSSTGAAATSVQPSHPFSLGGDDHSSDDGAGAGL